MLLLLLTRFRDKTQDPPANTGKKCILKDRPPRKEYMGPLGEGSWEPFESIATATFGSEEPPFALAIRHHEA